MRKLGEALDADPTAIYRHFRSKDELLRADRRPQSCTDRRRSADDVVARAASANCASASAPPTSPSRHSRSLVRGAPPRHHNELMITETILGELRDAGFDAHLAAARTYHAVIELTIGSAAIDSTIGHRCRRPTRDPVYDEWRSDYAVLDSEEFPRSVDLASIAVSRHCRRTFRLRARSPARRPRRDPVNPPCAPDCRQRFPMASYLDQNRASWDDRAPAHAASPDYAFERFAADPTSSAKS